MAFSEIKLLLSHLTRKITTSSGLHGIRLAATQTSGDAQALVSNTTVAQTIGGNLTSSGNLEAVSLKSTSGVLPTPSLTYRGQIRRLEGATGVKDKIYTCSKLASDDYAWEEIIENNGFYNIVDFGGVGDNSTDNNTAIVNAIAAMPSGSTLFFPVGTYITSQPISINKYIKILGENSRSTIIKCHSSFTEGFIIRNWLTTDYAGGETDHTLAPADTVAPQFYPAIENLTLNTNNKNNITGIGWVNMQESGFIKNIVVTGGTSNSGTRGVYITSNTDTLGTISGGFIENIVGYGLGWYRFIHIEGSGSGNIQVRNCTTAPVEHSDSPFYISCGDISLENITSKAFPASASSNTAVFRVVDGQNCVITNSFISIAADQPKPILKVSNTNGSGFRRGTTLSNINFSTDTFNYTGNLIEDNSQSSNPITILGSTLGMASITLYDGMQYLAKQGDGSTQNIKFLASLKPKTESGTGVREVLNLVAGASNGGTTNQAGDGVSLSMYCANSSLYAFRLAAINQGSNPSTLNPKVSFQISNNSAITEKAYLDANGRFFCASAISTNRTATTTPVTVTVAERSIITDLTVAGAVAVNLPTNSSIITGQRFTITDGKGDAATNNITVTPSSGTINGAANFVINNNYGSLTLEYIGSNKYVVV